MTNTTNTWPDKPGVPRDPEKDGGWQEDGSYHDPCGGRWPKDNPVTKLMRAALEGKKE